MNLYMPPRMKTFLEREALELRENGMEVSPCDVVRALINSYYEKKVLGLVNNPND